MVETVRHSQAKAQEMTIERDEHGKFAKGNSGVITASNAREMQAKGVDKRKQNQREQNDLAMMAAIKTDHPELDLETEEQYAAYIIAQQTRKAISPTMPGSTAAAKLVLHETGRSQDRQTSQAGYVRGAVDMALLLKDALRVELSTQPEDAEWREIEPSQPETHTTEKETPPTTSGTVGNE